MSHSNNVIISSALERNNMKTSVKERGIRFAALGAAASLALIGTVATGAPAMALNIDEDRTGSITVHKYTEPGDGQMNPDGTGTAVSTDPIDGVIFQYCAIEGIDLLDGTNAGWDALNAITAASLTAAQNPTVMTLTETDGTAHALTGCVSMAPTEDDGESTVAGLDLGAYFVRELNQVIADEETPVVISKARPFVLALPTPTNVNIINNPDGLDGEWVYDVNVYPKNIVAEEPKKNIVKQNPFDDGTVPGVPAGTNGTLLGSPVSYEITTKIPAVPDPTPLTNPRYTKFIITDTLDTKLDPVTTAAVTVKIHTTSGAGVTTVTDLLEDTDFDSDWDGQKLTVEFTPTGLGKLIAGQNVVVGFTAAANTIGEIANTAFVNLNDLDMDGDGTPGDTPTNTVFTRWGQANLKKVNAENLAQGLAGAEFEVYVSNINAAGCLADFANLEPVYAADGITPYIATAGADGQVNIAGLWVGDTELVINADGSVTDTTPPNHDFQQRCYVLKETKAPAGFVLPSGDAALTEFLVKTGETTAVAGLVNITNDQQIVPGLPLTGAQGQTLLIIGGSALGLIAIGLSVVARRRTQAQA